MMNEIKNKVIPAGVIFTVTCGEYSDYYTLVVCKSLKEINVKQMQQEYLSEHSKQAEKYSLEETEVINWMINTKKYAEEIDFFELHLGSYSVADFSLQEQ